MKIFPLPYSGEFLELIWPQVTEIKILRYTSCRYWFLNQLLKVLDWYLKNCSHGEMLNSFEVGSLDLTWDDLGLKFSGRVRNWCMKRYAKKRRRIRYSWKTSWCGQIDPYPHPTRAKIIFLKAFFQTHTRLLHNWWNVWYYLYNHLFNTAFVSCRGQETLDTSSKSTSKVPVL